MADQHPYTRQPMVPGSVQETHVKDTLLPKGGPTPPQRTYTWREIGETWIREDQERRWRQAASTSAPALEPVRVVVADGPRTSFRKWAWIFAAAALVWIGGAVYDLGSHSAPPSSPATFAAGAAILSVVCAGAASVQRNHEQRAAVQERSAQPREWSD